MGNARLRRMHSWLAALTLLLAPAAAIAADPPADEAELLPGDDPAAEAARDEDGAHFMIAFAGGALLPQGAMEADIEPGLDVWGRFGWITPSGIGVVVHVEYAPLRHTPGSPAVDEVIEAHLFSATAGPRFTLGRRTVRLWISGGAGVMVERTSTTASDQPAQSLTESGLGLSGGGGVDLCFFGSGGITLAGAYTRGVTSGAEQEYVSLNAGLVFVY
jgi:hypothetical protein